MKELKKNQPFKLIDYVTFVVTMFFIAYYFLRLFEFFIDAITFVIPLIMAVGYMVLTMNWSEKTLGYILGLVGLVAGTVFVEILCTNDWSIISFISMFTQLFMDMFPLYLAYCILKSRNRRLLVVILIVIFLVLAYVITITFIELSKDDRFMREMGINYTNYKRYNTTNAGGYQFAYAIAVLIGLLISLFLIPYKKYNKQKKAGLFLALAVSFFLVLNSSYTLALMICIIVIFVAVTMQMKKTSTKVIFWLIGAVGFWGLLSLSDVIIALVPTEEMQLRLSEVFAFLKAGDSSGYNLNGRLTLYWRSIKVFFQSPIIGNVKLDFNPHSSILRFFARDGILGGMGYLLLYYFGYHIILKYFIGEEKKKLFTPVFVSLMLMGLVNPIHSVGAVHYIVFLIAPLTLSIIKTDEEEENETSLGN